MIRPRQVRNVAAAVFSSVLVIGAVPAVASASCSTGTLSTPFTQFNDKAQYSLLQGGSFESGAPGWSLTNASVVSGNETYYVRANTDSRSLAVQPTGVAVSPAFCVDIAEPSFRFFARQISGSWAQLTVVLRWKDSSGTSHDTTVGSVQSGTSWAVTPVLQLGSTLPVQSMSTISAKLVFEPAQYGGAWAIDDVYLDPYRR